MRAVISAASNAGAIPCSEWALPDPSTSRGWWARDAIGVADAEPPAVTFASEDRGDPEIHRYEFVAAGALDTRVFDGYDIAEIIACPSGDLVERRGLTAEEHRINSCRLGRDKRIPDDRRGERIG